MTTTTEHHNATEPPLADNAPSPAAAPALVVPEGAVLQPVASSGTSPSISTAPQHNLLDSDETPALPPRPDVMDTAAAPATPSTNPPHDDNAQDEPDGPDIVVLKSMFPDFDSTVLHSVLESVGGDQGRAIDVLLGMSDPNYVSTAHPAEPAADVDLDEQLARQLALQEEEQHNRRHASGANWPRRGDSRQQPLPPNTQGAGYVTGSERGDFAELQDNFKKIAESGKRTFSSIVSKVRAKINEYDQSPPSRPVAETSAAPQWGTAAPPNLDRHATQQAYHSQYYGPSSALPPPQTQPYQPPPAHSYQPPQQQQPSGYDVGGYDVGTTAPPSHPSGSPPVLGASPSVSPRPSGDISRPPTTRVGSPINAAKLGMLPKRPVSLLPSPAAQSQRARVDDDDELEYAENPFEDSRK